MGRDLLRERRVKDAPSELERCFAVPVFPRRVTVQRRTTVVSQYVLCLVERERMITQSMFAPWLKEELHESPNKTYRHRLLTENPHTRDNFLNDLSSYVRDAHEDARRHLHELFENTLDPFGMLPSFDPTEGYPEFLHMQTLKGYFGEIFAGLIAEHFSPFGEANWKVPVFLFRYHLVAFQELERLSQTGGRARQLPGRTGDDCLAFQLDEKGKIARYLYCEAKCTSRGNRTEMVAEAHKKASESVPVDLQQIIRILQQRNGTLNAQWKLAIQQLFFALHQHVSDPNYRVERCDMVSYICGESPVRGNRTAWLSIDTPHEAYKAQRRLEVEEIHLPDVEVLIRNVYGKKDESAADVSLATAVED